MPDQFKEVKTIGYRSRIGPAIKGVLLGLILFFGSFALIFWNEGRDVISNLAAKAIPIVSDGISTDASLQGSLVSVRGTVSASKRIGDGLYLLPGDYIKVDRIVEIYAWVQHQSTKTKKNIAGSETQETNYDYQKEWITNLPDSGQFKIREGHENPDRQLARAEKTVVPATIGAYQFDPRMALFPVVDELVLTESMISLKNSARLVGGKYVYTGKGTFSNPEIGDTRVVYRVIPSNETMTLFGKLNGDDIGLYTNQTKDVTLFRLFYETPDEAVQIMHSEYTTSTWLLRLAGFLLMWIGLLFVFKPISVVMDILPILGSTSQFGLGIISLIIAAIFSLVTIVLSNIVHNFWLTIPVGVIGAFVMVRLFMKKRNKVSSKTT